MKYPEEEALEVRLAAYFPEAAERLAGLADDDHAGRYGIYAELYEASCVQHGGGVIDRFNVMGDALGICRAAAAVELVTPELRGKATATMYHLLITLAVLEDRSRSKVREGSKSGEGESTAQEVGR